MQRDLDELRTNDGWKEDPEFKEYTEAIETMLYLGKKENANLSFFVGAPEIFFHEYDRFFVKHVSSKVQRSDIVVYLVGGNSVLARMLL